MTLSYNSVVAWAALLVSGSRAMAQPASDPAAAPDGVVVLSELTREFHLQAGEQATGNLVLRNYAGQSRVVRIYQTDYAFSADGQVSYGEPGKSARSNAGWIELNERQPELPAGAVHSVGFKLTVPTDDKLSGTYWSMIMIEPLVLTASSGADQHVGITSIMRYAVQVVVQIGTKARAKPEIFHQVIEVIDGRRRLHFDLANNGERWLRPNLEMRLFDSHGRSVNTLPGRKARVYPGTSVRHVFDLANLAPGAYLALLIFDDEEGTYGASYRFEVE